jgi:hypothetical protein
VIKSSRLSCAEPIAGVGKKRGAYRVLVAKSERRKPLGTPRRRREDHIKMDF